MAGPGDEKAGKAWRTVRKPSDVNEYAKQIIESGNQEKFVKVLGVTSLVVPMPAEPAAVSCTLNNGTRIRAASVPFHTLTIQIRRDPHIIAQFKAVVPPAPPRPPPMTTIPSSLSSKGSGMRSFFHSSS
ncbi:hypothetical protein C8R42DRAFT_717272 [Lentinula raphanica]|nr:hypothetical protein C8R42DRAFT_725480 [Lentinula raphanica]KAJ3727833.1 hypothetical protein C8R42DRAFT_717272 [Lentinula raphanica]